MTVAVFFYFISIVFKTLRFELVLGKYRVGFLVLLACQFVALSLGNYLFAFVYEAVLLSLLCFISKEIVFPSFYSLILFRLIDSAVLIVLILITYNSEFPRLFILFLAVLLSVLWLVLYSLSEILLRAQKYLIKSSSVNFGSRLIVLFSKCRSSIKALSWKKSISLEICVFLSVLAWFCEWFSLYCIVEDVNKTSEYMILRIVDSFTLIGKEICYSNNYLDYQQSVSYFLIAVALIFTIAYSVKAILNKRVFRK